MSNNQREEDVDATSKGASHSPTNIVIQYADDIEFDIRKLLNDYFRQWKLILLLGLIFSALALSASFTVEKRFTTSVVTKLQANPYIAQESGLGAGSLISMALGGSEGNQRITDAIAILRGVNFPSRFSERHGLLTEMFAEKWDEQSKTWHRPGGVIKSLLGLFSSRSDHTPTELEVFERFSEMVEVELSGNGDLLIFRASWRSPELAVHLSHLVIKQINRELWERDVEAARELRKALYEEARNESNLEIKAALFKSISRESEKISFANANDPDEYLFAILDGPYMPDKYSFPNRKLFASAGFFSGVLIGLLVVSRRLAGQASR